MSNYYIGADTETGDFEPENGDLLTAYFGVFDEDHKLIDELDMKLKPNNGSFPRANAGALAVNKIDIKEHMANPETITYEEGTNKLVALLKKYHKKIGKFNNLRYLGYNVPFDKAFILFYLLNKTQWRDLFHYKQVDVMEHVDFLKDCAWLPKELGSLGTVVEYLSLPKRNAHEARSDVLMTIDVRIKLMEMMKAKKEGGQTQDLISLLEAE